ncbi:Bacterial alpha-L-rhamnosidase [Poriferisphaera corsica]|uniref:Bacterial alpha-L-rhamnosidase n=1 Tax=Poriferisphaera corsica TaxID=2528020 RepID=A0A517YRQ1_9BACT|nr:glycosyl hydrolase family 65 protein [Poriferisphaera corsica]QDU32900.1 Bacterial alpha-L-rhamnosidase [Poriferisphaera corsica]
MTDTLIREVNHIQLSCSMKSVVDAWQIAIKDLKSNIKSYQTKDMPNPKPCIMAGNDYSSPWTRDAAINSIFSCSLLLPQIAKNTLLSVLTKHNDNTIISGEYWDKIIWIWGAWDHWLHTRDNNFLRKAYEAGVNTIRQLEEQEMDTTDDLFFGPGWDGCSGYPDPYATATGGIYDWKNFNPDKCRNLGEGFPIKTFSTNCIYAQAYSCLHQIKHTIRINDHHHWQVKENRLIKAINKHFWCEDKGYYRYLCDPIGYTEESEALGQSYAIIFKIADDRQRNLVFKNQPISNAGIPSIYPDYKRYQAYPKPLKYLEKFNHPNQLIDIDEPDARAVGRHCAVWPFIQGFWALAACLHKQHDLFDFEFNNLLNHAIRDQQFAEIYHPDTTEMYGGLQEISEQDGIVLTKSCTHQTWSATAYMNMVLHCILGIRASDTGMRFHPHLPKGIDEMSLINLKWHNWTIDLTIRRATPLEPSITITGNDEAADLGMIPISGTGHVKVAITL